MDGEHTSHVMAGEAERSIEPYKVQRDDLWGVTKRHGLAVVNEATSNVRDLRATDIGGGAAAGVATDV